MADVRMRRARSFYQLGLEFEGRGALEEAMQFMLQAKIRVGRFLKEEPPEAFGLPRPVVMDAEAFMQKITGATERMKRVLVEERAAEEAGGFAALEVGP